MVAKTDKSSTKLTVLLISSLTILSMLTISASLPDMAADFKAHPKGEQLVKLSLSFPALFIAISAMIAGPIIDRYGRLKLLGPILVVYAIAGSSGYWLEDLYLILAGRAVLGICVGFTMTIATTLIADYYQGEARQRFAGIQIAFMSLVGIAFVSIGGVLADINWRVPFLIYLLSLLFLPLAYLYLVEPQHQKNAMDSGLKSPRIIWAVFMSVLFMWMIFFIVPIQIPFRLKEIGLTSNTKIGLIIASATFFSAVSSFLYGKLKSKFSYGDLFVAGYILIALAFACIAFTSSISGILLAMLFSGLGMGILIPNANLMVMQLAPLEIRGKELGRLTTFWFLGQFLSPLLLLPLLNIFSHNSMFMALAVISIFAAILFLVFRKRF